MPTPRTALEVVAKVCTIPVNFTTRKDIQVVGLLEKSGYVAMHDAITVPLIEQHLLENPHLIDDWASYSEDRRCGNGWFLDEESFTIGHYSTGRGRAPEQKFSKRSRACAEFIKLELDSMLENQT